MSKNIDKILIIEDEIPVQQLLTRLLDKMALPYITALDGDAGLQILEEQGVELKIVIIDLIVPNSTGWEVLYQIKQTPQWAHIKTVILTGANASQEELDRLGNEADAVLLKSDFTIETFRETLTGLLSS